MPAIILFDIDGTLLDCAGAGRRAMVLAFGKAAGRPDAVDKIVFGGMTDRAIARLGLSEIGAEVDEAGIDAVISAYRAFLEEELPKTERFRVHDGALELVELAHATGHAVGLGTGNVRDGARLKLERAGVWHRFDFGGFGCDAEARDVLLSIGRARGAERLRCDAQSSETLVIGDTPRDVHAAHAIGAKCLAVTTGRFDRQQLSDAGADRVVASLSEPAARAALTESFSQI